MSQARLETKVGVFVLIGLALLAALHLFTAGLSFALLSFGTHENLLLNVYDLGARFSHAQNVLSRIRLAGINHSIKEILAKVILLVYLQPPTNLGRDHTC